MVKNLGVVFVGLGSQFRRSDCSEGALGHLGRHFARALRLLRSGLRLRAARCLEGCVLKTGLRCFVKQQS